MLFLLLLLGEEGRIYHLQRVRTTLGIFHKAGSQIENSQSPLTHSLCVFYAVAQQKCLFLEL